MARNKSTQALKKAAREALILCSTASISSESNERLSQLLSEGIDWDHLLYLVDFHGNVPLVAHNLITGFRSWIPEPYLNRLNQSYSSTMYRNVLFSNELGKILSVFDQKQIAVISLKGTVLAEVLYDNPALRSIADMDILVHSESIPEARSILMEMGYQQMARQHWDHHFHDVPYCKTASIPFFLELHWDLEDRRLMSFPEQEIWQRAQSQQLQGISTRVLSPEDNLLFLSTHLSKHSNELLKFLGDIAGLLKKYEVTLDWEYIVSSARSWQADAAVHYALVRARDILGAPVPASALAALKPGFWRRCLQGFLATREDFVTPIRKKWLRDWTFVLVRALMMKHPRQMLAVLARQQGKWKRWYWLRVAYWVMLVLAAALYRNTARLVSR